MISAQTINFTGPIESNGTAGGQWQDVYVYGGGGSGGSVRVDGANISISSITASGGAAGGAGAGAGGVGRVAVYYSTGQSVSSSNPAAFIAMLGQQATLTPTATAINFNDDPISLGERERWKPYHQFGCDL